MSRISTALEDIRAARAYTCEFLQATDAADWFQMPAGVTHVAWQVAHLAVAEYGLCLGRIRGPRPEDESLLSSAMRRQFGKGSVPDPDVAKNPTADQIRTVFDAVHEQAMNELAELADSAFDEPVAQPHPRFTTKGGALAWAARHEMLHAGQIALLRRQLGAKPLR